MSQDSGADLIRLDLSLYAAADCDKEAVQKLLRNLGSSFAGITGAQLSDSTEVAVANFKGGATGYILELASKLLKPAIGAMVDYITKPGQPNVIIEFELPPSKLKLTFDRRYSSAQELVDAIIALHAATTSAPSFTKTRSQ